ASHTRPIGRGSDPGFRSRATRLTPASAIRARVRRSEREGERRTRDNSPAGAGTVAALCRCEMRTALTFLVVILLTPALAAEQRQARPGVWAAPTPPSELAPTHAGVPVVAHGGTSVGHGDVVGRVAAEASAEVATLGTLGAVPAIVAGLSAQPCPAGAYVCL